jgi:hypothetical protein
MSSAILRPLTRRIICRWWPIWKFADLVVCAEHLHLDGRRDEPQRPAAHAGVERDHARARAVAVFGADSAGEHVLGDVDLMFFAIDVSPGTHAATSVHIECPISRTLVRAPAGL